MGYDVHRLVKDRKLIIGGVNIPYELGLLGHSDADVLTHAIMDSLLGAAGLGDIGKHFPDSSDEFKGISSIDLLERVGKLLDDNYFVINNIDATIIAQEPKMAPYIEDMKTIISEALKINSKMINIKATTEEGLGFTGKKEGISAQSITLISEVGFYTYLDEVEEKKKDCGGCSGCHKK